MKNYFILTTLILLSSCALHTGNISSSSIGKPVIYEDIAVGVVQTTSFCGIGGSTKDGLVLEAKRSLIESRPLRINEEYANFTLDYKRSFFAPFIKTKVTMSADVVSFIPDSLKNTITDVYTETYKNKLLGRTTQIGIFNINDSVQYGFKIDIIRKGVIISFESNDEVRILYKTEMNEIRTKKISINEIFTISKEVQGMKVGDEYIYTPSPSSLKESSKGKIIAFGLNYFYMRGNDGLLYKLKYQIIK